ncbi:holin [Streptomyces neyagawaensis]|uniref:holin n=1 Tax=Streptomyces neyagawaensis TaxID=42238 RepID=UPI00099E7D29|nr:holin [Streptomyces neyagawaensis]MCL6733278.1 holin [Streptomyces neyagawaensis]MDE1685080.1 holin [Streptomyces neyagawaensis]
MFTRAFWKATAERMIRTFAQAVVALLGGDGLGLVDIDWDQAFSIGGLAAVAALLTAIVTSGGTEGPGVTETVARPSNTHRLP